jgi:hypothetical protein
LMQYDITAAGPLEAPVVANEALAPGKVAWNRATQVFAKGFNVPINVTAWNEPGTNVLGNIAPEAPAGAWHKLPHELKKFIDLHLSRLGEEASSSLADKVGPQILINAGRKTSQRISWIESRATLANFDYQAQRLGVIEVFRAPPRLPGVIEETRPLFTFRVRQEPLTAAIPDDPEVAALLKPHMETLQKRGKKRVELEFWTMPECPGCIEARPQLERIAGELSGRVDVTLRFVVSRTEAGWSALHGEREANEAKLQALIQKYYPEKIWQWLAWRETHRDAAWTDGAAKLGLLQARLRGALAAGEGDALLAADNELMQRRRVEGTPSLVIANKMFDAPIERLQILRALCGLLDDPKPAACKDVPACFFDAQCRKRGYIGRCIDAGKPTARCDTSRAALKVPVTVIVDRECLHDNHERIMEVVISDLPGAEFNVVDFTQPEVAKLLESGELARLPAYVIDPIAKTEYGYDDGVGKAAFASKDGKHLMLRPFAVGAHRVLNRKRIKGRVDLFVSRHSKNGQEAVESALDFLQLNGDSSPQIEFHDALYWKETPGPAGAKEPARELAASGGLAELEEAARAAVVKKLWPEKFNEYLLERGKKRGSSYWDSALKTIGVDPEVVRKEAEGPSDATLRALHAEADLLKSLDAGGDITLLAENCELIAIRSRQDLRDILNKVAQRK